MYLGRHGLLCVDLRCEESKVSFDPTPKESPIDEHQRADYAMDGEEIETDEPDEDEDYDEDEDEDLDDDDEDEEDPFDDEEDDSSDEDDQN